MRSSAPFSAGAISGSSSGFTVRSSIAFAVRPVRKSCASFNCVRARPFSYTCGAIDLWEWEVRLLDQKPGVDGDDAPLCLGGRGAAPPEHCGGPTGYRMMLKRQQQGEAMCTPVQMEAVIGMLAASDPDGPTSTWQTLREVLNDGFHSIDRRLQEYGPLEPERFSLEDANQRLARHMERMRFRA